MKYNAMIKRLQRRGLTKEDIAKVVAAKEKIVSLLKKADVNHANNARDVFVRSILQRKEQHELW